MTVVAAELVTLNGRVIASTAATADADRLIITDAGAVEGSAVSAGEFGWSGDITVLLPAALRDSADLVGPLLATQVRLYLGTAAARRRCATMVVDTQPETDRRTGETRLELRGRERAFDYSPDIDRQVTAAEAVTIEAAAELIARLAIPGCESLVGGLSGVHAHTGTAGGHAIGSFAIPVAPYRQTLSSLCRPYGVTPFFDHAGVFRVAVGVEARSGPWGGFAWTTGTVADWTVEHEAAPSLVITGDDDDVPAHAAATAQAWPEWIDWRDPWHSSFGTATLERVAIVGDATEDTLGLAVAMASAARRRPQRVTVALPDAQVLPLRTFGWVDLPGVAGRFETVTIRHAWASGGRAATTEVVAEAAK